ncbi:Fur-regulated basic protein FbpA [Fictibacillus iocasae]|uniref:Fur-regulated basic protein FbpA n=1 Tax=Fictibacillus iocasae TaxID=2715437 RepID=A0ABW2NTQ0_9BACL
MNDDQKDKLITSLLGHNIYKTSDGRHLYEVSLEDLEREYKQLLLRPSEETS